MSHDYYYLSFTPPGELRGTMLLNGFPVSENPLPARTTRMDMLNMSLCGARNLLRIDLNSVDGSAFALKLELKAHAADSIVTPSSGRAIPISDAAQPPGGIALQSDPHGRLTFEGWFATPGLDFSDLFFRAPPVDRAAAALFAKQVVEAFETRAIEPLLGWHERLIRDVAVARGISPAEALAGVREEIQEAMSIGLAPGWAQRPISFRPWCEGRLLEAVVSTDRPLIKTVGGEMDMPCFIAQVDGRLQVVR